MTALYTKLDNFFNCCNVPLSIIDLNSNFLYERNLNKLSKDTLIDLNIVDKIAKNNINLPQEIQSGHLKIVAIPFANNNKNSATFLLLGPFTTSLKENESLYYINCEKGLNYFIKLLKLFLSYKNTCSYEKISDVSPIIKESLDYVHKNYAKQITINDICDKFKINKCYFCCMFKKETGQTFINYLNNYKIERSKDLLKNTNMTLLDISLEVGFNNQSYYSTIFKKYFKVKDPEMKRMFQKNVQNNERCSSEDIDYGIVKLKKDKRCPFLDEENYCVIHSNLGEDYLSNVCTCFPRVTNKIDDTKNTTTTVIIVFDRPNLSNIPPYITRPIPLQIDIRPTIVATEDASIFFAISFTIPLACDISAKPDALRRIAHTK